MCWAQKKKENIHKNWPFGPAMTLDGTQCVRPDVAWVGASALVPCIWPGVCDILLKALWHHGHYLLPLDPPSA